MDIDDLKQYIEQHLSCAYLKVNGDGRHFNAVIVSDQFINLATLRRQQLVYGFLSQKIASGELHAFTMKTYTPDEWKNEQEKKHG